MSPRGAHRSLFQEHQNTELVMAYHTAYIHATLKEPALGKGVGGEKHPEATAVVQMHSGGGQFASRGRTRRCYKV